MLRELGPLEQKVAGYIGLAQRAGKVAAGDLAAHKALKNKKARLLVVAADAAPAVQKELQEAAQEAQIDCLLWQSKAVLGLVVGKSARGALAVCDEGFAKAIKQVLQNKK